MNINQDTIFTFAIQVSFFFLSLGLFLVFIRLVKGPSLPDRVVALDFTAIIFVGFVCIYCISVNQPVYLDMAIALALISFLGTVAIARYALQIGKKGEFKQ